MDLSLRGALWIISAGVIAAGLYYLREPLTQLAMAFILWLTIHGLSLRIKRYVPQIPRWLPLPLAIVIVLGLVSLIIYVMASNIGSLASNAKGYGARLDEIVAHAYVGLGLAGVPPTVGDLLARVDPALLVGEIGSALQNLLSNTVFILIFLGFMFPAVGSLSRKMDLIFTEDDSRQNVREMVASIRGSMERYLYVQTVASLIITVLTFITLEAIGLDNALFWSFLIFFLNFIPTIGSIVAVALPTAFALVQFPTLAPVAFVALGVGVWQFIIGNFVQPRMTGESLNLATLVVLLALAVWGAIWGIPGAFLAAPLTVMLMIVLAQFESTRWIAILLSADGKPTPHDPDPPATPTKVEATLETG
ncbi:MAG: AI-2E family transporter [Terricaulis sp.]